LVASSSSARAEQLVVGGGNALLDHELSAQATAQVFRATEAQPWRGQAAIAAGAASRGSGNAGTNKEKSVRQWFVDHDLIESVLYLPENLFYNTTAPGIVLFLNKAKPKARFIPPLDGVAGAFRYHRV
jgi:hypothetical protein